MEEEWLMKRADALRMEREKRKTENEMGGLCDERLGRVGGEGSGE